MFAIILIVCCASFFYRIGSESKVPGSAWAILSVLCYLGGEYAMGIWGGPLSQIALFVAITIGRVVFEKKPTKRTI